MADPLQNIIININSIRSVKQIVKKIEKLSGEQSCHLQHAYPKCECKSDVSNCDITFENFSLSFGPKTIIDDFSFNFKPGKKYLVVGLNGSGKSTLFKSLKKWYLGSSGAIKIDGKNVKDIDNRWLSNRISYMNENVSMFSGTVKDNIVLFRDYNDDKFDEVIKEAKIQIDLDREVSDEGRNISSGEQRRIEIARSMLESVRVLIFDEVVSTLDIETAYEIEKMALGLPEQTVIFISHNFSGKLIKEYDEILVMENGKLLDHGTFDKLLSSCEYFKKICEIKFG